MTEVGSMGLRPDNQGKNPEGFKASMLRLVGGFNNSLRNLLPSRGIEQTIEGLEIGNQVNVVVEDNLGQSTTNNWYVGEVDTNMQILTLVPDDPNLERGGFRTKSKRIDMNTIKSISVIPAMAA